MKFKLTLFGLAFMLIASGLAISIPESASAATAYTWDAPANGIASLDTNWDPVGVPTTGDSITFDGTSTYSCTSFDIAATFTTFNIDSGYTGTVTVSSDFATGAYTQVAGTITAPDPRMITCSGNWLQSAGTMTAGLGLTMTGAGTTLYSTNGIFGILVIAENVAMISYSCSSYDLTIGSGKTFTIGAGLNHQVYCSQAGADSFTNNGIITGGANSIFRFLIGFSTEPTLDFGVIATTYLEVRTFNGGVSKTLTLAGSQSTSSRVYVGSYDATATTTLDVSASSFSLDCGGMTIGTRGILNARESTITCGGSWDSSAGTFTVGTSTIIFTAAGSSITPGTSQEFYDVQISGRVSVSADMPITHDLTIDSGQILTVASGIELEYDCSSGGAYSNLGTIAGSGNLTYVFDTANKTLEFGTIATYQTWIKLRAGATETRWLTMSGDSLFCGNLVLSSEHASYYMVFDTTAGDVTVRNNFTNGTRGIVYYDNPWTIEGSIPGETSYVYQVNTAGGIYYAENMITGLIEFLEPDYADNITQYAIDNLAEGEEVNFANGTYVFECTHDFYIGGWNCSVFLNESLGLSITGSGASVLKYREGLTVSAGKGVTIFLLNDQAETLTIRGLEFELPDSITATYKSPMFLYHPTGARPGFRNTTISECTFSSVGWAIWGDGMYYMGANNSISDNTFYGSILAFHNLMSNCIVSGNTFVESRLWLDSVSNVTASNNTFSGITDSGIFLYDVCKDITLEYNRMEGISAGGSMGVYIYTEAGKPDCDNITVRYNAFEALATGVNIEGANDTIIESNAFLTVPTPISNDGTDTIIEGNLNFSKDGGFSGVTTIEYDGIRFANGMKLGATTDLPWLNLTVLSQTSNSFEWIADNGDSDETITFVLSGLGADIGYHISENGTIILTDFGPSFSFVGYADIEYELTGWYGRQVGQMVMLAVNMVGMGIMIAVIGGFVMPLVRDIKKGKMGRFDQMMSRTIRCVVFIIVGLLMWGLLHQIAIG